MPQIKNEETRSQLRRKLVDVSCKVIWECTRCKGTRAHENITKMRQHLIRCVPYQAWKVREPSVNINLEHEIGIDLTDDVILIKMKFKRFNNFQHSQHSQNSQFSPETFLESK